MDGSTDRGEVIRGRRFRRGRLRLRHRINISIGIIQTWMLVEKKGGGREIVVLFMDREGVQVAYTL